MFEPGDETECAHRGCRFWTGRAKEAYRALLKEVDATQTHAEALALLREGCCRAVCRDDPESLAAALALADRSVQSGAEVRFATAIAAMAAKKYACAYCAWDDGGACWSRQSDDPWLPDSARAADVLMRVCEEAMAFRGAIPEESRDAGETSDLCRMMSRLSTFAP